MITCRFSFYAVVLTLSFLSQAMDEPHPEAAAPTEARAQEQKSSVMYDEIGWAAIHHLFATTSVDLAAEEFNSRVATFFNNPLLGDLLRLRTRLEAPSLPNMTPIMIGIKLNPKLVQKLLDNHSIAMEEFILAELELKDLAEKPIGAEAQPPHSEGADEATDAPAAASSGTAGGEPSWAPLYRVPPEQLRAVPAAVARSNEWTIQEFAQALEPAPGEQPVAPVPRHANRRSELPASFSSPLLTDHSSEIYYSPSGSPTEVFHNAQGPRPQTPPAPIASQAAQPPARPLWSTGQMEQTVATLRSQNRIPAAAAQPGIIRAPGRFDNCLLCAVPTAVLAVAVALYLMHTSQVPL